MNGAGVNVRILETDSHHTPLGIRFWDPIYNTPVREGLQVTLEPTRPRVTPIVGKLTPSGVYAFHHVPGLVNYEATGSQITSPPVQQNYVVRIVDLRRRYSDTAFALDLPLDDPGALFGRPVTSPATDYVPGVLLYSSATRRAPPAVAVIRGSLRQLANSRAAQYALIVITDADGRRWSALADAQGQFAALFPYPAPATRSSGSPPRVSVSPLPQQTWAVSLEVFHTPELPQLHVGLPDYRDILTQPPVGVAQILGSPATLLSAWSGTLQYGVELVARSDGESELWIGAPVSPET